MSPRCYSYVIKLYEVKLTEVMDTCPRELYLKLLDLLVRSISNSNIPEHKMTVVEIFFMYMQNIDFSIDICYK